jgi:dihydrodipicolinate synthase/N-acetylneuraminate lyase
MLPPLLRRQLLQGQVVPAHPLALDDKRRLDERRQRALTRYYIAAGAGGVAVGVHTTQFAIREPQVGLFEPVLKLASEVIASEAPPGFLPIAGVCGPTAQALAEARFARDCGYQLGLLSLSALKTASTDKLLDHCRAVADIIPVMGFYLQPAVGGRLLDLAFWRRFAEIEEVAAIKIAPFNRYQTLDVLRAVAEAGRQGDIALYTGNDDTIAHDLLTRFSFGGQELRIAGGLLGHWAVWTQQAASLLRECHAAVESQAPIPQELLTRAAQITDANAAFFDAAHGFAGCIAGLHEVLRRQGLLRGIWCLDPEEGLSPGQREEIDRVCAAYPQLNDDEFVTQHLDEWLR